MERHNTLIHRLLGHGGTLWTTAKNSERPAYEEALRRYQGPAQIVVCEEAYFPTGKADVVWGPISSGPLQRLVDRFSVHVLNGEELPDLTMTPFYHLLQQVRVEQEQLLP
jgi:hypothetical protein